MDITLKSNPGMNGLRTGQRMSESEEVQLQHILENAQLSLQRVATLNTCIKAIHMDYKFPHFE
jgi:hypothetical protein